MDLSTLGIKLPFLVMIIKNLKKYFTFEVQVLDDKNVKRRFRASNYQSTTRVKPFICTMPMRLDDGWNQIQFNLSDFTRRAYGTNYIETLRVQVTPLPILDPCKLPHSTSLFLREALLRGRTPRRVQVVSPRPEQGSFLTH
ncbi:cilia- and flagella-associated protein 20-like [Octopus sinensis]|uniref:Cilia- and flagella-associated protein 20-like n=1 Tax=Octopus sinensis TaxID=2607531 RepID=A0A7E6EJM4_9MOLL|nr:cilia- and flagella-associated protein 20-like [Octopus sinensis]